MYIAKAKVGFLVRELNKPLHDLATQLAVYCKVFSNYNGTGNEHLFPAKVRASTP